MIISLMGFMGSGKSTFGRRLADHYKLNFIDLDDYIVENEKMSICLIISVWGLYDAAWQEKCNAFGILQKY